MEVNKLKNKIKQLEYDIRKLRNKKDCNRCKNCIVINLNDNYCYESNNKCYVCNKLNKVFDIEPYETIDDDEVYRCSLCYKPVCGNCIQIPDYLVYVGNNLECMDCRNKIKINKEQFDYSYSYD